MCNVNKIRSEAKLHSFLSVWRTDFSIVLSQLPTRGTLLQCRCSDCFYTKEFVIYGFLRDGLFTQLRRLVGGFMVAYVGSEILLTSPDEV